MLDCLTSPRPEQQSVTGLHTWPVPCAEHGVPSGAVPVRTGGHHPAGQWAGCWGTFPEPCEVSTAESTWLHLTKGKTHAERRDSPKATQLLAVEPGSAPWLLQQTSSLARPGQSPPRWDPEDLASIRGASSPNHSYPQPPAPGLAAFVSHP